MHATTAPRLCCTAIVLTASLLPLGRAGAADWKGHRTLEDGIETVYNPNEPMQPGTRILVAEELWRAGGESEAPEDLFGVISSIQVDADGNSYLLDTQLTELKVFGPDGAFLGRLGREGEAPGEFQQAWKLLLLDDDRLGLLQYAPARIVVLGRDGSVHDDLRLPRPEGGGFQIVTHAEQGGGNLVLEIERSTYEATATTTETQLVSVSPTGEELATYAKQVERRRHDRVVVDDGDSLHGYWHVGPRGRVWIAPSYDEYRLDGYDADGRPWRVIRRDFEPRRRTEEELQERKTHLAVSGDRDIEVVYDLSAYHRAVGNFDLRSNGEIWVYDRAGSHDASGERRPGIYGVYDVFDSEGRYAQRVELQVDFDPEHDSARLVGDRIFVIRRARGASRAFARGLGIRTPAEDEKDEDDDLDPAPVEVVCYRLVDASVPHR